MATPLDPEELRSALAGSAARWQADFELWNGVAEDDLVRRLGYVPGPGEPDLAAREQVAAATLDHHRALAADAAAGAVAVPPAAWDWRNAHGQNYVTPVRDQGSCGSCVAFAAVATVEGAAQVMYTPSEVDLSEGSLFYCVAEAQQGRSCGGSNAGWWVSAAMDAFRDIGVPGESCFPYTAGDQACAQCGDWAARALKITGWRALTDVADMKSWIATTGPLVTAFTVYADFFTYSGGVYHHVTGGVAGGHAVSVVGYDDAQGCWICKNSWGPGWGENGFFRIAYGECGIDAVMWGVSGIAPLVPAITPGAPTAATRAPDGTPRVYFPATDGHVHELAWIDGWHNRDLNAETGAPLPAATTALAATQAPDGEPRAYYVGADGHVHELAWIDGWHDRDLNAETGAPLPAATTALAATRAPDGEPRVYYVAIDGHVHELAWFGGWHNRDLNAESGAPGPKPGSPLAATQAPDGNPRVYYVATDGHVHELAWIDGWHNRDLNAETGAPVPAATSALAATKAPDGEPRVYYVASDGHVHELAWFGGWHDRDPNAESGAPAPAAASALAATQAPDGEPRVYYVAVDGHVHELAWFGGWHNRDLNAETSSPAPTANSALAAVQAPDGNPRAYYTAGDGHLHELAWFGGGWHGRDLALSTYI